MVRHLLRILWLLPILAVPVFAWGDELVVTSDHGRIGRDQTFVISVRHNGSDADFTLDTTPLEKDFYVIPKGSGHQAGKWLEKRFQLGPKHTGVLRVPSLSATFQGKTISSHPFPIRVLDQVGIVDDARLWIETHADRGSAWQRQQLVYRFTVFNTNEMASSKLSPPDFRGFRVEAVRENAHSERVMDGRRVQCSDYTYLLFPQRAGELKIAGPVVHATLLQTEKRERVAAGQSSFGDERHIPRPKVAEGRAVDIHVRPLPAAAADLPVGRLAIKSGVSESRGVAGEPLTWTVTLQGKGMLAVSLPDLRPQMHIDESFKTYPETPDISLKKGGNEALALGTWRVVALPQASGRMSLPAVEVPYFDPQKGRVETAAAKAVDLLIAPARQAQGKEVFRADPSRRGIRAEVVRDMSGWWKWATGVLLVLWLATLAAWLLPVRRFAAIFRERRQGKQPDIRRVLSAPDSLEQFARLKEFLGVSERLSPLGLLDLLPQLEVSEAGRWLKGIEESRYGSGRLPPLLDAKSIRRMREMLDCPPTASDDPATPENFGRIGPKRRSAV